MNAKYVESLEEVLQLEKAFAKKLPIPADGGRAINNKKGAETPLTPEDHRLYRKGVGIFAVFGAGAARFDVCVEDVEHETGEPQPYRGRLGTTPIRGKVYEGMP